MKIKKYIAIGIIACISVSLYGCDGVNLSEEEEELYVAYASNSVINHDNNYILKLKDAEIETETTTAWHSESENITTNQTQKPSSGNSEEETTVIAVNSDMNSVIGMPGIDVKFKDFLVTKSYPETENVAFVIKAVEGSNLIILRFTVKNTTESDIMADFSSKNIKFKGIFNGQVKSNCQITFLGNAMNTYKENIPAGESKELVLIYEVSSSSLTNISTIKLDVTNGDLSDTIIIKN